MAELGQVRKELQAAQSRLEKHVREATTVDRLLTELRDPAVRDDIRAVLSEIIRKSPRRNSRRPYRQTPMN
jgi:hypothetical protein